MRMRYIGARMVGAIGLGAAHLSLPTPVDRGQAVRTIHAALDAGIRLIDTAAAYVPIGEPGHNEALVAEAVGSWDGPRAEVLIGTKGGHYRGRGGDFPVDGRPEAIKAHCEQSVRALGAQRIGLYSLHWPDPRIPWHDSIGALGELRDAGKIDMVGLSNVTTAQIREASGLVPISAVQNRLSIDGPSWPELAFCTQEQIAFTAYSPLGGKDGAASLHGSLPRFNKVARARKVSVHRIVLAWLLAQSPVLIPICGARRPGSIADSAQAADLDLTPEELAELATEAGS